MMPKIKALAAFTRYGSSAPAAPRSFIAFHSPGARNPTPPMTKALKKLERYHFRGTVSVDGALDVGSDTSSMEGRFTAASEAAMVYADGQLACCVPFACCASGLYYLEPRDYMLHLRDLEGDCDIAGKSCCSHAEPMRTLAGNENYLIGRSAMTRLLENESSAAHFSCWRERAGERCVAKYIGSEAAIRGCQSM